MRKKLLLAVIGFGLTAAASFLTWQHFMPSKPSATVLTEQEAKRLIEEQLGGSVTSLEEKKKVYHAKMEKQNHIYEIELNPDSGDILSLSKVGEIQEEAPPPLTEEEITKIAIANAAGKLSQLSKTKADGKTVYKAVVEGSGVATTLMIDAATGKVLSKSEEAVATSKNLTEAEAVSIAAEQVKGELDDISLSSFNGQTYYLCEIQTPDGREAIVQVHAITGEVMSVAWDDHDDIADDDD